MTIYPIRILHANRRACARALRIKETDLDEFLSTCNSAILPSVCKKLKSSEAIFEVTLPDRKLHSGISTFFDQIGKE